MVKKCTLCGGIMEELKGYTPEDIKYNYYKCKKCGEEIVDMSQLHNVAEKYRKMKRYNAKLTRWGKSIGLRIPKELAKMYKFNDNKEVLIIPESKGIKVIPV